MTKLLPLSYDNIDSLAASALAASRDCATALREDVIPNLTGQERLGPQRLIRAIDHRMIFSKETLVEIDVLIEKLSTKVLAGTTTVQRFDADESNVSAPACWQETKRTREAEDLGRALVVLLDLQHMVHAVNDLMDAERIISDLRQRG